MNNEVISIASFGCVYRDKNLIKVFIPIVDKQKVIKANLIDNNEVYQNFQDNQLGLIGIESMPSEYSQNKIHLLFIMNMDFIIGNLPDIAILKLLDNVMKDYKNIVNVH